MSIRRNRSPCCPFAHRLHHNGQTPRQEVYEPCRWIETVQGVAREQMDEIVVKAVVSCCVPRKHGEWDEPIQGSRENSDRSGAL